MFKRKLKRTASLDGAEHLSLLMFDAAYPPPVVGGKEKQAHLLAKALKTKGANVKVLSYTHNGNISGSHEGIPVERFSHGLCSLLPLLFALAQNRSQFSLLHIHTPSRIGRIIALIGRLIGYRVIFKFPNEHLLDDLSMSDRLLWYAVLRTASLFVVLERKTKRKLECLNISKERIFYIANGISVGEDCKKTLIESIVNIIFVGRLTPQKCCDQLIYACELLDKRGICFHLTILGDGPLRDDLTLLVRNLEQENKISFVGHQSDTLSYMSQADILVLPSEKEGMSNVLLEAISIGLPIVSTNVGSAKDQVGPFGEQFLCVPKDPRCLANKIELLSKDPELLSKYGRYLHNRGHELFSIEAVATSYIYRYGELL